MYLYFTGCACGHEYWPRTRLVLKEFDEQLATTALSGARTTFNARLATFDMQLLKTALDNRNRKYARKQQY